MVFFWFKSLKKQKLRKNLRSIHTTQFGIAALTKSFNGDEGLVFRPIKSIIVSNIEHKMLESKTGSFQFSSIVLVTVLNILILILMTTNIY